MSAIGRFQQQILRLVPGYMQGPHTMSFAAACGALVDELAERTYQGMREAIPYAGGAVDALGTPLQCSPETLKWHARDRGVRLYASESLLSKRVRPARWYDFKAQLGTPAGALRNLQPFWLGTGYPLPVLRTVSQTNDAANGYPAVWNTLDANQVMHQHVSTPGNWTWDGHPSWWARWWVIMHLPPGYGSGFTYDSGPTYDSGAHYDDVTAQNIEDYVDALREGGETPNNRFAGLIITTLQPTDDIPGHTGRKVFDPADTAATDAAGWTSLPTGQWDTLVDPATGLGTRPPWASFVFENAS